MYRVCTALAEPVSGKSTRWVSQEGPSLPSVSLFHALPRSPCAPLLLPAWCPAEQRPPPQAPRVHASARSLPSNPNQRRSRHGGTGLSPRTRQALVVRDDAAPQLFVLALQQRRRRAGWRSSGENGGARAPRRAAEVRCEQVRGRGRVCPPPHHLHPPQQQPRQQPPRRSQHLHPPTSCVAQLRCAGVAWYPGVYPSTVSTRPAALSPSASRKLPHSPGTGCV